MDDGTGRPAGHAELVVLGDGRVLLARVGVAPTDRGRGFGRLLLRQVIENARALGGSLLELNVYSDNRAAVRLYTSAGFEAQPQDAGRPEVLRMALSLVQRPVP